MSKRFRMHSIRASEWVKEAEKCSNHIRNHFPFFYLFISFFACFCCEYESVQQSTMCSVVRRQMSVSTYGTWIQIGSCCGFIKWMCSLVSNEHLVSHTCMILYDNFIESKWECSVRLQFALTHRLITLVMQHKRFIVFHFRFFSLFLCRLNFHSMMCIFSTEHWYRQQFMITSMQWHKTWTKSPNEQQKKKKNIVDWYNDEFWRESEKNGKYEIQKR